MNFDYMTPEEEALIDDLMAMAHDATDPMDLLPKNKYMREIKPDVWVDVYDVLFAWKVTNPALQHLIKKALQAGNRGHKDLSTDMRDIVESAIRAAEIEDGD